MAGPNFTLITFGIFICLFITRVNIYFCFSGDEVSGKISLKHLYEIAKIKSDDPGFAGMSLEKVCKCLIGTARTCGIKIVPSLDVEEYKEFLTQRLEWVKEEEKRLEELRQAKMLRL